MCTYLQVEVFIEEKPKRHSDNAKSEKPQDEVDREHQELWDGFWEQGRKNFWILNEYTQLFVFTIYGR